MAKLTVTAEWDDEAKVWVATSDDVPGLVTEATTLDALTARIRAVVPELLADNAHLLASDVRKADGVDLCVVSRLSLGGRTAA